MTYLRGIWDVALFLFTCHEYAHSLIFLCVGGPAHQLVVVLHPPAAEKFECARRSPDGFPEVFVKYVHPYR